MPTQKRERKRQGHQARHAAVAAARKRRQQRTRAIAGGFLALFLVLGVAVIISPGNDGQDVASTAPTTTVPGPTTTLARKPVDLPPVPAGASVKGDTPCPPTDGSAVRTTSFEKPPPLCVAATKNYTADIQTSKGTMTVALDVRNATKTVNNFVVLARYKFFDGIAFHRVIPGFVLQGGDPLQNGGGGPGYRFEDELPKAGSYRIGSLAMANSGPNSNGSQFFIISGEAGVSLQPQYSLFGQVTQGLEVVKAIEEIGIPGVEAGKPSEVVKILTVTIKES